MASLWKHHEELTDGVGRCSKPMWSFDGLPAGFCDKDAFGPELDKTRGPYIPALACPSHGGPKCRVVAREEGEDDDAG